MFDVMKTLLQFRGLSGPLPLAVLLVALGYAIGELAKLVTAWRKRW